MKLMPRVLLLLFLLSALTMLYVAKCGLYIDLESNQTGLPIPQDNHIKSRELFGDVIEETERKYQNKIDELQGKITALEDSIRQQNFKIQNVSTPKATPSEIVIEGIGETTYNQVNVSGEMQKYFEQKLKAAEILHGIEMKTEYEITAFNRFTLNRIYLVDPGLGKRVVEKPIGLKRKDLHEVISFSIDLLNKQRPESSKLYSFSEFVEGVYRAHSTSGTQYELYFRNLEFLTDKSRYSKVIVMRPFGPLLSVSSTFVNTGQEWINLILPLKNRIDSFLQFMNRFTEIVILKDKRVFLTVVYFGSEGLMEAKNIMSSVAKNTGYKHLRLINLNENFSRGRGLQVGVQNWKNGDVILFLCDVDIVFSLEFLERCRLNTDRTKKVYYPIVFSLYNPKVVYTLQGYPIPPEKDQLIISKQTGFWRDFGYGMTCQYRSDFMTTKGFDETFNGWGGEDVALYKKYVRSHFMVMRATDPGIFHLWHEKYCDPKLPMDQYQGCIRSKALSEASHAQLGFLAFKDEMKNHKNQTDNNLRKNITNVMYHDQNKGQHRSV